jgi:transcriptional regulator with XRE-family HTH domain
MSADCMTPSLNRAARAILNWSTEDLAERTGAASTTIRGYENGTRKTTRVNRAAMCAAFAGAGVEFAAGRDRRRACWRQAGAAQQSAAAQGGTAEEARSGVGGEITFRSEF